MQSLSYVAFPLKWIDSSGFLGPMIGILLQSAWHWTRMQSKRKAIDNAICVHGLMLNLIPNLLLQRTASNVPTTFFYANYVSHIKNNSNETLVKWL